MADIFNMVDTWNDAGTTFAAIKMNVTDTASNAASNLIDLQVGGVSQFSVRKNGILTVSGGFNATGDLLFYRNSFSSVVARGGTSGLVWSNGLAVSATFNPSAADWCIRRTDTGIAQFVNNLNTPTSGVPLELREQTAPSTPAADHCRIYAKDNGAGLTQLVVLMPDGVETVLATET